jgi:predicted NAD/FAD-binding protein
MTRRVAVIGAGAAGLSAAYRLQTTCEVTLFEREARLGGHAWTWEITNEPDAGLPLDVCFMVTNRHNYPKLYQLFAEIGGIELGPSEMSFSYCCRASGEEYAINYDELPAADAGSTRTPRRSTMPPSELVSLYSEIARFCMVAARDAASMDLDLGEQELGAYLEQRGVSKSLCRRYILPMGAALWSAPSGKVLRFPAALFLRFMHNHGLLNLSRGRTWQHILGGSRTYVDGVAAALAKGSTRLRTGLAVTSLRRDHGRVTIQLADGRSEGFDAVVVAVHADQALALLADPSSEEAALLSRFTYQTNEAILHCDEDVMPRNRDAWASWNYERESYDDPGAVCITYHLNRLQGHSNTAYQYFLSLNRRALINPKKVLARFRFTHPLFSVGALRAQRCLKERGMLHQTCFAGSYLGYGFHEDAIASGLAAANLVAGA